MVMFNSMFNHQNLPSGEMPTVCQVILVYQRVEHPNKTRIDGDEWSFTLQGTNINLVMPSTYFGTKQGDFP